MNEPLVELLAIAAILAAGGTYTLLEWQTGGRRETLVAAVGAACSTVIAALAALALSPRDAAIWWVFGIGPLYMGYNFNRVRMEDWLHQRPVAGVVALQTGATLFLLATLWFLAR